MENKISLTAIGPSNLDEEIMKKRKEMFETARQFGISSLETLVKSQELDVLINAHLRSPSA